MELFKQILQQCRTKYESKPTLTLQQVASKREVLYGIEEKLKAMQSREIYHASKDLCEIFNVLVQSQAGFTLTSDIANILKTYRIDPSIIINEYGKKELTGPARIQAIQLLGHIFERVPVMGPPTKEIFDTLIKQVIKFAELRVSSFTTIKFVIKSGHMMQQSEYVLKTLLKAIQSADQETRELISACLATLTAEYPSTFVSWQNVWPELMQTAIKQMEVCESATLMVGLMQARLNECKLQGDLKTSFKTFNFQQRDVKKKTNMIDVPRTLADIISFLAAMMHKIVNCEMTPASTNIRTGIAQTLTILFENNCEHLESVPTETLLNSLLLTIPSVKESPSESIRQREIVTAILTRASDALSQADQYKKDLLVFTLQSLKQNQLVLKMETLQEFQSYASGKNTKISTLFHDGHISCLLRLMNELLKQIDQVSLQSITEKCVDFLDPVLVHLTQEGTRIFAVEVIQTLGSIAPVWIHQLISIILSNVQISTADIQSMKQGFIYTNDKQMLPQIETLNSQSQALACLFKQVLKVISGEPVALAATVFNSARQQILGKINPDSYQTLEFDKTGQSMRREAGWITLEGLIYLGQNWVNNNIDSLLTLFRTVFSKSMCQFDLTGKESDLLYKEAYIQEFKIKQRAISALLALLTNFQVDSDVQKTISALVTYAFPFIFPKDKTLLSAVGYGCEFKEAQSNLLGCLNFLPLKHFQHKFVGFLHSICDVIISEDIEFQTVDEQDSMTSNNPLSKFKQILAIDPRIQYKAPILRLNTSLARLEISQDYCSDTLVANAIAMFVKIFASQTLNVKNKDQLAKHLAVHTAQSIKTDKVTQKQVSLPYRPEKTRKLGRIGKTICEYLQIQDRAPYPNEENMVQEIVTNLQNQDLKAQFTILCSEIKIAADHHKIITQGVGCFLDVLEESLSAHLKQNNIPKLIFTAAYCGHLVRYFDSRIGIPFDRITNIFFKLLSDPDTTLQKYSIHFLADICQESVEFASQIVPICFDVIYGVASPIDQKQILRLLQCCHRWDDSKTSKILITDQLCDQKVLFNYALKEGNNAAQILARVVEGEQTAQMFSLLIDRGLLSQLELKFKDKGFLNVLIDHLNIDEFNTLWLLLYRKVLALTLPTQAVTIHLGLIRSCIAYTHLSPLMAMETKQLNMYRRKLSDKTILILITELTLYLNGRNGLQTSHALELLAFALSVVSQNEKKLKLAGLDLIRLAIIFLKDKTEQVGDFEENDSLSPRSRQLNSYLQNPLVLEQYEAQIFSVIRQHLTGDVQPEVVQGTLDLAFTFVTLPITKDQGLLRKILHMLTIGMEKGLKLLGADMFSHEGLITETHFLKLELLSKLFLKSKLIPEPGQPTKFNSEDRESLAELFTNSLLKNLQIHWRFALQDCLVLDHGQSGNLNLLTFVQGGTYSLSTLFSVVPSLLEALLHLNPNAEVQNLISASLFQGLLSPYSPNTDLHQFYKSKVTLLQLTQVCLKKSFDTTNVSGLLQILQHLTTFGIIEINKKVLQIYTNLCENHAEHIKLDLLQTVMGQLQQSQPELNANLQLNLTAPNFEMIEICLECLTSVSKYTVKYDPDRIKYLFGIAVVRVCISLNKIPPRQQPFYVKYIWDLTNTITTVTQKLSSLTVAILTEMRKDTMDDAQITAFTHLMRLITVDDMPAVCEIISSIEYPLLQNINLETVTVNQISKQLLKEAFVCVYNDIKGGAPVCMRFILKMYSELITEVRSQLLLIYIAMLLQVIQTAVDQQLKLLAVNNLVEVFKLDTAAFKKFATSTCEMGQPLLTPAEQTVIENVIRTYQTKVAPIQPQVAAKSVIAPPTQSGKSIKLGLNFKR